MWRSAKRADFEQQVRDHLPDALRLAQRLTNCPDTAEEIVQMALLRASRGWRSFRGDCQFQTWLYRIVVNSYRDMRRKAKHDYETLPGAIPDPNNREPADVSMDNELGQYVAACMARLPARQREVLVLVTYENLSASQIADLLEITTANVHATLHVARKRMRELLEPYFAET
jgi:RNA polymerase sigma-70 factor (ECF subfamily)